MSYISLAVSLCLSDSSLSVKEIEKKARDGIEAVFASYLQFANDVDVGAMEHTQDLMCGECEADASMHRMQDNHIEGEEGE